MLCNGIDIKAEESSWSIKYKKNFILLSLVKILNVNNNIFILDLYLYL